eukprot:2096337-Amphidinium_carterae.1
MDAPVIIQFSSGGSQFYAGKGVSLGGEPARCALLLGRLDNSDFHACIAGAISGAYHVRAVAEQYGEPSCKGRVAMSAKGKCLSLRPMCVASVDSAGSQHAVVGLLI